jgi:hypothetical protein
MDPSCRSLEIHDVIYFREGGPQDVERGGHWKLLIRHWDHEVDVHYAVLQLRNLACYVDAGPTRSACRDEEKLVPL